MEIRPQNIRDEIESLRKRQEAKNRARKRSRRKRLAKRIAAGLLFVCLLVAGILFVYFPLFKKDFRFLPFLKDKEPEPAETVSAMEGSDRVLYLIFADVNEGDCTIVYDPADKRALIIDAGAQTYADHVVEQTRRFGEVEDVWLILSHPHADHMNGMTQILKQKMLPVSRLYYSAPTSEEENFSDLKRLAEQQKTEQYPLAAGDEIRFADAAITIVSPENKPCDNLNNASLALLIAHFGRKVLIASDMEREAENALCDGNLSERIRDVDLLRIGHHGSNSSSSYRFLDVTYPGIAVISVGADNPYGHPDNEVLSRLFDLSKTRSGGCEILRTDMEGDIVFISDSEGLKRVK